MPTLIVRLDPARLANPDADLRHRVPGAIVARSNGAIVDDGYDYVGDGPLLMLFFHVDDVRTAHHVLHVIEHERVLENDLRSAAVAIQHAERYEVLYPTDFQGDFWPADE